MAASEPRIDPFVVDIRRRLYGLREDTRTRLVTFSMAFAISVQDISKLYRLGGQYPRQLLADLHRWWTRGKLPGGAATVL